MSAWSDYRDARFSPADMDCEFLESRPPLPTLVPGLDAQLFGWQQGVNVVAAEPGVGKSALALYTAYRNAAAGVPTVVYTLEMSAFDCWCRMVAASSVDEGAALEWPRVPHMAQQQLAGMQTPFPAQSRRLAAKAPGLAVVEPKSSEPLEIAADMHAAVEAGAGLLVVDYLQYMRSSDVDDNQCAQVTEASHVMQRAARELKVPIVLVSSMNRSGSAQAKPDMHSVSGSGAIEYDATTLTVMWRDKDDRERLLASVEKNRRGPVSSEPFELRYWPTYNYFTEAT